jgi:polysaccharide pyruvyl transferase WcaK-like protein
MVNGSPEVKVGNRNRKILVDGPYGKANLGDNAIAWCIATFLRGQGMDVTISCMDPEYISSSFETDAVPMLNYKRLNLAILRDISEYDAVIVGGGQQLQEYKVPNPFIGMLPRVCRMAEAANQRGVPFFAWAVGMDSPLSPLSQRLIRRHLGHKNVTLILRDHVSFENAKKILYGTPCTIVQSKDVVFMIKRLLQQDYPVKACSAEHGTPTMIISPSLVSGDKYYIDRIIAVGRDAVEKGFAVRGWHSEIRPDYDPIVRNLADWNAIPDFDWLPAEAISTRSIAKNLAAASLVLTTRMHPAIIAASLGVRAYGIATNDKMRNVFDEMMLPYTNLSDVASLTFDRVIKADYNAAMYRSKEFGLEAEKAGRYIVESVKKTTQPDVSALFNNRS